VKRILITTLLMAAMAPAMAITPANTQGPAQSPAQKNVASPAPTPQRSMQGSTASPVVKAPLVKPPPVTAAESRKHAEDSAGMRRGVVQKVDIAKGSFHVYGQPVSFDPKRVRVIGADGKSSSVYELKQGASVRFTLDPADPTHKRAAVIYVN